jgi:hypothetical protein
VLVSTAAGVVLPLILFDLSRRLGLAGVLGFEPLRKRRVAVAVPVTAG